MNDATGERILAILRDSYWNQVSIAHLHKAIGGTLDVLHETLLHMVRASIVYLSGLERRDDAAYAAAIRLHGETLAYVSLRAEWL